MARGAGNAGGKGEAAARGGQQREAHEREREREPRRPSATNLTEFYEHGGEAGASRRSDEEAEDDDLEAGAAASGQEENLDKARSSELSAGASSAGAQEGKQRNDARSARWRAMSEDDDDDLPGSRPSQVLQWMSTVDSVDGAAKRHAVPKSRANGQSKAAAGQQQQQQQQQQQSQTRRGSRLPGLKLGDGKKSSSKTQQQQQQQKKNSSQKKSPQPKQSEQLQSEQQQQPDKQPSSSLSAAEDALLRKDEDDEEEAGFKDKEMQERDHATDKLNDGEDPMETIPAGSHPDAREHGGEAVRRQRRERGQDENEEQEEDPEPQEQAERNRREMPKAYSTQYLDREAALDDDNETSLAIEEESPVYSKSDVISPGMINSSENTLQGFAMPQLDYRVDIDDDSQSTLTKVSETSSQLEEFRQEVRERFDGVAGRVIFPNSDWILAWDLLILLLILFCVIYVPFQIGISDGQLVYQRGWAFLVFTFINIIFIIDVALNFYRVYFDAQGRPVISRKRIQLHYLRGWFFIDVLACLPVDIIYRFVDTNIGGGINVMAFVNILRIFRLNRAYRIVQTNSRLLHLRMRMQQPALHLIFVMSIFLLFAHWGGCMYCFVALVEAGSFREQDVLDDSKPNWLQTYVNNGGLVDVVGNGINAAMGRYTLSLYWAITTISSVGYGDLTPHTLAEYWYTTVFMFFAGLMWSFFLGVVISTLEEMQEHTKEFQARIGQINRLSRYFQRVEDDEEPLPFDDPHLATNARQFLHKQMIASSGKSDGTKLTEMASVLSMVPPRLRNRLCLALVRKDLLTVSYFRHFAIDLHTIGGVASLCEIHQYDTGEIMYLERNVDATKRGVFIVREGVLAICEANSIRTRSMRILAGGGTIMDDYVLFPKDAPEVPPIVTIAFWTFSEVLFVPRKAIRALFRLHPEVWHSVGRWRVINIRLARWARSILGLQNQQSAPGRLVNTYSSGDFRRQVEDDSDRILRIKKASTGNNSSQPQQQS
ncbi:Potassium voltage-gated channel subfamily H member 1 [Hondaea fermentalgiana]|uniref:Potassium voltage-gated channel subfamily H member 1 n=1 Tax=Hondaea fermentalgiana TaxID=2315210 RepID=A0A2R5GM89_9STRA|nr:Potassium voltage-gated channel subfamily H member 1 [Hondaea fermentalgiana]|eukprot:GBG31745.1 Potassium voltage-gated channel subfamily H member 1 [Hondaea fermentalgiana]